MSIAAKARLLRSVSGVTTSWLGERVTPRRSTPPGSTPPSTAALSTAWLTFALCSAVPGAEVVHFELGTGSDGTCARQALRVAYNTTGTEAGLPTALYTKSSPSLSSRLLCGLNDVMIYEGQFYLVIRPELHIETPVAYHCSYDGRSGRSMLLFEDIVATRGATFSNPTLSAVSRSDAEAMVTLMATYHRAFWDDPRLDTEFRWLIRASDWQRRLNDALGFGRMFQNGIRRSRDFLPPELLAREKELWPAFLRSIDLEDDKPQTLVHQDPHSLNWYRTRDGRMGLYDWQVTTKGSWALDIPYALGCGLQTEDRRNWERDLVHLHLDQIAKEVPDPPEFADAWMSYRQQIMHGLGFWLASFGRTMLQPEINTRDVSIVNIRRLAQAVVDLDTLDAIRAA